MQVKDRVVKEMSVKLSAIILAIAAVTSWAPSIRASELPSGNAEVELNPPVLATNSNGTAGSSAEDLHQLVTAIARSHIPHNYENWKQWGKTSQRFDGLHISLDGLRLKTKRRKKEVNHGTWKMYRVYLIDPQQQFQVRVENIHDAGNGGVGFELLCTARLHIFGRLSQWVKGVQIISLGADADAQVRLRVSCQMVMRLDATKLPPDVLLRPSVSDANLEIVEFRLQQISDLHGPLVKELSSGVREVLEDEIEDRRPKLVRDLNSQIEKNQDQLRISVHDLLASRWSDLSRYVRRD